MKTAYQLINHWVQYGRPGGTQLDFDVNRGSTVVGQFESRAAAEQEIQRLQTEQADRTYATWIDEEFDTYEIREIEVPE